LNESNGPLWKLIHIFDEDMPQGENERKYGSLTIYVPCECSFHISSYMSPQVFLRERVKSIPFLGIFDPASSANTPLESASDTETTVHHPCQATFKQVHGEISIIRRFYKYTIEDSTRLKYQATTSGSGNSIACF